MKTESTKVYNVMFMMGLPDNRQVFVMGYDQNNQVVYNWNGNTDFHSQITDPAIIRQYYPIVWFAAIDRQIQKPDIIVNCMNDADISSKSLAYAADVIKLVKEKWPEVKVFNPPEKVANTSRNKIYELYKDMPALHIPKSIRITPKSVDDVVEQAKNSGIKFPFIIRASGAHQSDGLKLIENKKSVHKLEAYAFDGREYYVTEFVDYKSKDGLYRKARLIVMNGQIFPRHYMTGETWLVHGDLHDKYMASRENTKLEEEHFINNFREMISQQALDSVTTLAKESGLDYLGFDIAIKADGSLLVFEINPAQNGFVKLDFNVFPYMENVCNTMINGLNQCIENKLAA